jgi:putative transcription factor
MSDQDWNTRVLKKDVKLTTDQKLKTGELAKVSRTGLNKSSGKSILGSKDANDFDPENISKLPTSTLELKHAIQEARKNKKMSQADLDKACNFPRNTIRDYENGKAVLVPDQLNKMNTVLGVKLPRPKKTK